MTQIAQRIDAVRARIAAACAAVGRDPAEVHLLAVSKTHPASAVRDALPTGQRIFGENRIQDLAAKAEELVDTDARWHMIGSIQTNNFKQLCAVPNLALVHGVDRIKLVEKLAETLTEMGKSLDVLLQVNATGEDQKHGALPADVPALADAIVAHAPTLNLVGMMGMGPIDGDPAPVFAAVARLRDELQARLGRPLPVLSLGMSGDLEQGIAAGSTLVRIGTDVFGQRDYH